MKRLSAIMYIITIYDIVYQYTVYFENTQALLET